MSRWTPPQVAEMVRLREVEGYAWPAIARLVGRTSGACKTRYAVHDGRRLSNGGNPATAPRPNDYQIPHPRPNDDTLHLRLLLDAIRQEKAA